MKAITLRSEKELQSPKRSDNIQKKKEEEKEQEDEWVEVQVEKEPKIQNENKEKPKSSPIQPYKPPVPYPERLRK